MIVVNSDGELVEANPGARRLRFPGGRASSLPVGSSPLGNYAGGSLNLLSGASISYSEIYRTQAWVGVMVNKLYRQISRTPLKVYRLDSNGDRERVREHPLVDLVERPSVRNAAIQLKQWMSQPTLIHGNAALMKIRTGSSATAPRRLWPLDWRYLTAYTAKGPDRIGEPILFWRTWEFGFQLDLAPDDVIHFRWDSVDSLVGVSPLEQLGTTVRIERAAQEFQENYLENGVRPPSAIVLPKDVVVDKATRQEMREDLEQVYSGSKGAGRPALLSGGVDWKSLAHDANEAELIEQRRLTREEVAAVYDVPPPLVGILDKATFSNIAVQREMLFTIVLGPWFGLIEETLNAQLIASEPQFEGLFVEFDTAGVLRGDPIKELASLKTAVQTGLLTINEARQKLNLKPYPYDWCNQPLIPANNLATAPAELPAGGDGGDPPSNS